MSHLPKVPACPSMMLTVACRAVPTGSGGARGPAVLSSSVSLSGESGRHVHTLSRGL